MITIKVYYITRVQLHVITRITSSCVVSFLHSMLRFCCDKTLFEENNIEGNLNFNNLNIHIFKWSTEPHILTIIFIYKIYCKIILLLKFEDFPLSLQRKIKFRITAVNTIEKTYENVNKTNEEDIATIEVIEKKFEKLSSLNSEIQELAEDAENNEKNI